MKPFIFNSLCVGLCALLTACGTSPAQPTSTQPETFFRDALFAAPTQAVNPDEVFAMSDAMTRYLHIDIARQLRSDGPARGLVTALYRRDQLKLDYDTLTTRNAAQAFEARQGNCLSLVLMTAAFAKALDLQVSYQTVEVDEIWSRADGMAFLNSHVNVTLGPRAVHAVMGYDPGRHMTIDFLPADQIVGHRNKPVSEDTVVAMYLNNKAAEALGVGQLDEAYAWVRAGIQRAPQFLSPYNTLGVIYTRHGDLNAAEQVFSHVLNIRPNDKHALANLAGLLSKQNRVAEAKLLQMRLAKLEPYPPYYFFQLGTQAMERGEYKAASEMFAKEVQRADHSSEFHFWLSVAHFRLGDIAKARTQMALAIQNSSTRSDQALYSAKLERLRSYGVQ
jgi:tetratricopeptide (TPR) repeat protein